MASKDKAIQGRADLSQFVIHLTRNDSSDGGYTAPENFKSMLADMIIEAYAPHCLHSQEIPDRYKARYNVACFTEVPLTQLHQLTKHIRGRKVQLQPYGFVFRREFIVENGAQPVININSYGGNREVRDAADELFEIVKKNGFDKGKVCRLLPFLNAMHEAYDFSWEREWRIVGGLEFEPVDVVAVVLPKGGEEGLRAKFIKKGIPVLSPGLTYEEIVYEFSLQQRATKTAWVMRRRKTKSSPKKSGRSNK
ncbi:hypothetical protein TUM4261_39170 [Shewanella sp. c952]|uniref:hypothetical protein n=1 Tax=Shewanella sp. c952 TaxID=2815913 RepID=UPI001BB9D753|nr:hypothetical protein [Shewanella sp. c952]GIU18407.1 hypothetical protein TUM4261_39170 [Shewanella sp. c952]